MRATLAIVTLGTAFALSACGQREAGSQLDRGDFGNATMNNTLLMTNEREFAVELTRRFAADVPNTITFDFNSAALGPAAQAALDQQAAWIAHYPFVQFSVFGHTDLVGSASYNKRLGMRRARAAVDYLVSRGVSRAQLKAVVSYGKTHPLVYTPGPDRRNRRTVTEVSGTLKKRPMIFDGKYMERTYRYYLESAEPKHPIQQAGSSGGGTSGN